MQNLSWRLAAMAAAIALVPSFAIADEWVATKLRGGVLQLVDGDWVKLKRGDVVSDDSVIRTIKGARVAFERGNETIELGGDTQIQIFDKSGRKFTTVRQHFGTVTVEADVRAVQHFSVQTPHIAAVVKGTKFTVVSGPDKAKVSVQRGHVAVEDSDTHQTTVLSVGQTASTGDGGVPLAVSGRGTMPVIYGANGKPAAAAAIAGGTTISPKAAAAAAREAALAAGASKKEADRAAKAAEKDAKEAAKGAEKHAAAAAYQQAVAAGASPKEAEKAAKEAAKESKEESKAAEKEAKAQSKGSDHSGPSGSSGSSGPGSDIGSNSNGGGNSGGGSSESGNSGGGNSGGSSGESNGGGNGNSGGDSGGGGKGKKDKD